MPELGTVTRVKELRPSGTRLSRTDYLARFREEYPRCTLVDKVEARQEFREPGYAPWEAAQRGDWTEAVRLAEAERPVLARQYEDARNRGCRLRRVRLVELPPSDYVLWEMTVLRLRAELGERIGVISGADGTVGGVGNLQHPPQRICQTCSSSGAPPSTSCCTPMAATWTERYATPIGA